MEKIAGVGLLTVGWFGLADVEGAMMYTGYLLGLFGIGALLLYYRLWISTGPVEFRKLKEAYAKSLQTIEELTSLEAKWRQRAEELSTQHSQLHGEYLELRGQFSQLNIAYAKMGEQVAALRDDLAKERKLRDEQYMQWMREKAANGDL